MVYDLVYCVFWVLFLVNSHQVYYYYICYPVGRDCIGCAKTGSGKTAAFALPILQKLSEDPYGIYALVLTPTRELAFQIGDQFKALGKPIQLRVTVITGGRGR